MNLPDPYASALSPLLGLAAWNVAKGHGSALLFNFGEPHLSVREPVPNPTAESPEVREALRRRRVHIMGDWFLLIEMCHWTGFQDELATAHDEAADEIIRDAAREMDGQRLIDIVVDREARRTTFSFDLGARLVTSPYDQGIDEQWSLSTPTDRTFSYRADGRVSWAASSAPSEEKMWIPLM
jgi:hypothetical protein